MADLSFQPVATQIQPPKVNLGEILNMARGVQAYKQAQTVNPLVARQQEAQTKSAELGLSQEKFFKILDAATSEINDPDIIAAEKNPSSANGQKLADALRKRAQDTGKALGLTQEEIDAAVNPSIQVALSNPGALRTHLKTTLMQSLPATSRVGAMTPTGTQVTGFAPTGEKVTQQVNVNPFGGPMGAPLDGTVSFAGPGQTMTPTGRVDAKGNPTAIVTDVRTGQVREVTIPAGMAGAPLQPPASGPGAGTPPPDNREPIPPGAGAAARGPVPGGLPPPPPGAPANYGAPERLSPPEQAVRESNAKIYEQDWEETSKNASAAMMRIASLQKIKELAPNAFVGAIGERKKYLSSLAQAFGIPLNVLETAKTEELAKNSAILNLAGGNTDRAREIAELATPTPKMGEEGIKRVTDQLIGFENMKLAKQKYLGQAPDSNTYVDMKKKFDQSADPRMFQDWDPKDFKQMMDSLSPKERKQLMENYKKAQEAGIL